MSNEEIFFQLLLWLADQQDVEVLESAVGDRVVDVASSHPIIHSAELAGCIESESSDHLDGRSPRPVIRLPVVSGRPEILPCLTPRWRGRETLSELRLYLALYFIESHSNEVDALGFRYEQPEDTRPERLGRHNFWHAQPTPDVSRGTTAQLSTRDHPASVPAFPLAADTPAELLTCLLVSVYGQPYVRTLWQSIHGMDRVLKGQQYTATALKMVKDRRSASTSV